MQSRLNFTGGNKKTKTASLDSSKFLVDSRNKIKLNFQNLKVRELSKQNAAKVRDAFKREKEKQIKSLQNNIQVKI